MAVIRLRTVCLTNVGLALFLGVVLLQSASFQKFAALNLSFSGNLVPLQSFGSNLVPLQEATKDLAINKHKGQRVSPLEEEGILRQSDIVRAKEYFDQEKEEQVISSTRKTTHEEKKIDIHSSSVAVLDLLDWETRSLEKPYDQSCHVPEGVDEVCCLGTQSHTGKIKIQRRHLCDHVTLQDYQQLQNHAQQEVKSNRNNNHMACDACRIVEILRQHPHLKFAFFGDSLTNQVEQALACELQRRSYRVTQQQVPYDSKGDAFRSVIEYRRRIVTSPLWNEGEQVVLDFLFQYRLPLMYEDEKQRIATQYDILVFSMGLHWVYDYNPQSRKKNKWTRDSFGRQLKDFFNLIREGNRVQLLIHRETTATHFEANGGDYSLARRNHPNFDQSACVPLYDHLGNVSKWREPIVRQAAQAANYTVVKTTGSSSNRVPPSPQTSPNPELYVVPFYDFTASHWTFHPHREGPRAHLDCSHYCSSPFLFQPVWSGVRWAMDRVFGGSGE